MRAITLCVLLAASGVIDHQPQTAIVYTGLAGLGLACRNHHPTILGIDFAAVWRYLLTGSLSTIAIYSLVTLQGVKFAGFVWIAAVIFHETVRENVNQRLYKCQPNRRHPT